MIADATSHAERLPAPDAMARDDFELVVRRLADDLAFGADASLFVGSGLEYAGSRPYEIGDSIRAIHWRLTARTGRAYVRVYEALKRTEVYILVDTSASMAVSSVERSKHDVAVWMGTALGLIAQRRLSPVTLLGAGERGVAMPASLSRTDLWASVEPLRTKKFNERTRLAETLRHLAARALKRSVIIVISDLHDRGAIPAIRRAAQRHDCMILHTLDPAETRAWNAGFVRAQEPETGRLFFAARRSAPVDVEAVRSELLRCGADVLTVRTDQAFVPALRRFLSSRGGAMRGRG